jgi:hypothetical protein
MGDTTGIATKRDGTEGNEAGEFEALGTKLEEVHRMLL